MGSDSFSDLEFLRTFALSRPLMLPLDRTGVKTLWGGGERTMAQSELQVPGVERVRRSQTLSSCGHQRRPCHFISYTSLEIG